MDESFEKIDSQILNAASKIELSLELQNDPNFEHEDLRETLVTKDSKFLKERLFRDKKTEINFLKKQIETKRNHIGNLQDIRKKKLKEVKERSSGFTLRDVKLMCNKKRLDSLIDKSYERLNEIKHLETKIETRKILFEWLEDAIIKDKEGVKNYEAYCEIEDTEIAEMLLNERLNNKQVRIGELLKKNNYTIQECLDQKVKIKCFMAFWEKISSELRENNSFLKVIKEIIQTSSGNLIKSNVSPSDILKEAGKMKGNSQIYLDLFE